MRTFSTWRDALTDTYEVVAWHEGVPTIVQRNIKTREKALAALLRWRQREDERHD
jgi:hypothetical protein